MFRFTANVSEEKSLSIISPIFSDACAKAPTTNSQSGERLVLEHVSLQHSTMNAVQPNKPNLSYLIHTVITRYIVDYYFHLTTCAGFHDFKGEKCIDLTSVAASRNASK